MDSLGELPYFLVSCWEQPMESPGSIWEEGRRGRLGHFIPLAPSLRNHLGLAVPLTKDHSCLGGDPLHMSLSFQVLVTVSLPGLFQLTEGNNCVGTNIRALL